MKQNVYIREDFLAKTKTSPQRLKEWEDLKLIRPVGFTDESVPFYSEQAVAQAGQIHRLLELGYNLADIREIVKKVGLPRSRSGPKEAQKPLQYLTVGTLAERVGVSPRTIKHWEDKRIIVSDMRSEGGFRMYSEIYVYLCRLIIDLQLFGYSLEEIKAISDYFRDFLGISKDLKARAKPEIDSKLDGMLREIDALFSKIKEFKQGISRWEGLLKKKKKEIIGLKSRNQKRAEESKGKPHV
jgi:DNA-binding transcriptional MerR regulator